MLVIHWPLCITIFSEWWSLLVIPVGIHGSLEREGSFNSYSTQNSNYTRLRTLNIGSGPRLKPANACGADCRKREWKLFEVLAQILLRSLNESFAPLHYKGSYVYLPELFSYDKIEDSVLDNAFLVRDQHVARDVQTCGLQYCFLVNGNGTSWPCCARTSQQCSPLYRISFERFF
jgi:hypothetical protein